MSLDNVKLSIKNLDLFYGDNQALKNINIDIKENKVTALIGPSGCGKSTFLRTLNRMNDLIENVTIKGKIEVDGEDIYKTEDVIKLRTKVGMVFQKPNPSADVFNLSFTSSHIAAPLKLSSTILSKVFLSLMPCIRGP